MTTNNFDSAAKFSHNREIISRSMYFIVLKYYTIYYVTTLGACYSGVTPSAGGGEAEA